MVRFSKPGHSIQKWILMPALPLITSRLLLWWIFHVYWEKICPPCWNILGRCPAATLINYGQMGRKGSRDTDKHLCSMAGRVMTIYDQERTTSREGSSQSLTDQQVSRDMLRQINVTDQQNRGQRDRTERCGSVYPRDLRTNNTYRPRMFFSKCQGRCTTEEVRETDLMTSPIPCWVHCSCSISRNTLTACIEQQHPLLIALCSQSSGTSSHFTHSICTEMP